MVKIAVTGGIACGKSLFGRFLADAGVAVCDADDLAHRVMLRGTRTFDRLVEVFGAGILGQDGEIQRGKLGDRVFADPSERETLNRIVHPEVKQAWQAWLGSVQGGTAAVIIPLLYEIGVEDGWDCVVCIAASPQIQLRRLMARGLSEEGARRRMAAQMPTDRKMERADYVIVNDGTEELLCAQARRVLKRIQEK